MSTTSTSPRGASDKIVVFFDGACPICVKDRHFYEKLAGNAGQQIVWFDITDQDDYLFGLGISPRKAMSELHIQLGDGKILSELDAYIVLMKRVWFLKPVAWLVSLPAIRPFISKLYHQRVDARLKRTGRI